MKDKKIDNQKIDNQKIDDKRAFKILCSISIGVCILIVIFNAWVGPSLVLTYKDYQRSFLINLEEDNHDDQTQDDQEDEYFKEMLEDDNELEETEETEETDDLDDLELKENDFENYEDYDEEDDEDYDEDYDVEDDGVEDDGVENGEVVFVNINQADLDDLMKIPGVGEVLASRIISYREKNGPFESEEDLLNIDGIGQSRLESMADYIYFD